jgi:hypothetical protein
MVQLNPIQLDDGTMIYIESTVEVTAPAQGSQTLSEEMTRVSKGGSIPDTQQRLLQSFQAIEGTIRAYTHLSLNAFKKVAIANVEKVTLEFGVTLGGEAGIPYVTKGTAESNLKITVECSFPE